MSHSKKLHITMTTRETVLGWLFLVLELFVLPSLLSIGNRLLSDPLPDAWLNFGYFSLNFICVYLIFHRFLGKSLALAGKQFGKYLKAVILGFVAYWVSNLVLSWLMAKLLPGFSNVNDGNIASMTQGHFLLMAVGTVVLVPVVEETLYRGLLFQGLYARSRAAAYIVSTLVFCAIHVMGYIGAYNPMLLVLCFIQYIPAGLCLAWAYAEADCIFAPILIHAVVNAMGIYSVR